MYNAMSHTDKNLLMIEVLHECLTCYKTQAHSLYYSTAAAAHSSHTIPSHSISSRHFTAESFFIIVLVCAYLCCRNECICGLLKVM